MTLLVEFAEGEPGEERARTGDPHTIATALQRVGVRFERWSATHTLREDSSADDILATYGPDIERLKHARGYRSADVVRLKRDPSDAEWPSRARVARAKFLEEHTHAEDEVRFFVEGRGLFYLRLGGSIFMVLCERGDLLSVPAGTRHWFDMGSEPNFCAIRVFGSEAGWVAAFTGDDIARRFPDFDAVVLLAGEGAP